MKKIIFIILSIFIFSSCSKEPGSINGNVYWKYNDYVGNKPDAGSIIKIYSIEKNIPERLLFTATSDVAGNFSVNNMNPGTYLCVIHSKNTTSCSDYFFKYLTIYEDDLKTVFGLDLKKYQKQITEIQLLREQYSKTLLADYKKNGSTGSQLGIYNDLEKDLDLKYSKLYNELPEDFKSRIGYYGTIDKKIHIERVTIKEKEATQINHDFETTCY